MCGAQAEQTTSAAGCSVPGEGRVGRGRVWAACGPGEGCGSGQSEGFCQAWGAGRCGLYAGAPGGAPGKRECVSLRVPGSAGRAGSRAVHEGCGGPRGESEAARSARGLGVHGEKLCGPRVAWGSAGRPGGRALRTALGPLYCTPPPHPPLPRSRPVNTDRRWRLQRAAPQEPGRGRRQCPVSVLGTSVTYAQKHPLRSSQTFSGMA